jgi:hypothetical protein
LGPYLETHGAADILAIANEFSANMKFTPSQIRELAGNTRFPADNLEKVLRLQELLTEFHKHTILKGKLVLKGGTALNLFYLNLARLSVDKGYKRQALLNALAEIDGSGPSKEAA